MVNNEKITSDEVEVANTNISNIKNLKLVKYYVADKLPHSLSRHPTLSFYFSQKLNMNKSVQDADISVKILKENAEYICFQFNEAICTSKFPTSSKFAHVAPIFKQRSRNQKPTYYLKNT